MEYHLAIWLSMILVMVKDNLGTLVLDISSLEIKIIDLFLKSPDHQFVCLHANFG